MAIMLLTLTACEADATPVAAVLQTTDTPQIEETLAPPIRYALDPNTAGYVADEALLRQNSLVEQQAVTSPDDTTYDVQARFGLVDGWQQSPTQHHLLLLINTTLAPLNNAAIVALLRQTINTQALSEATGISGAQAADVTALSPEALRTQLANAGNPDGIQLIVAYTNFHALENLTGQLQAANITVQAVPIVLDDVATYLQDQRAHLVVAQSWNLEQQDTWATLVGDENRLHLYSLPISYRANEDIRITFTDDGWPIPSR